MNETKWHEQKMVKGNMNVSYDVYCPHCNYGHDDAYDKKWWVETFGGDFPIDNAYETKFEATCSVCKEKFIVDGFSY